MRPPTPRRALDQEACEDEEADEEADEADEEADGELEPSDEGFDWTTVSHGFCVSWHAHQDETSEDNAPEDGGDWKNHGEFVSHWAREGCRTAPGDTDEAGEVEEDSDEEDADAKAEEKAERKAEKAEEKAERKEAKRGK